MNSEKIIPSDRRTEQSQPSEPKLLERLALRMRRLRFAEPTIRVYSHWTKQFIFFHEMRHPKDMAEPEVGAFLNHLALEKQKPLSDQAAARNALVFLYKEVLTVVLGEIPVARVRSVPTIDETAFAELASVPEAAPTAKPKLLDQLREQLRVRYYSIRTEECYVDWSRKFILFHGKRHPKDMGKAEVEEFLTYLAVDRQVSISTQHQALNALVFLYKQVLHVDLGRLDAVRAKRLHRLPVRGSRLEVRQVLDNVQGADGLYRLQCELMCGTGMRIEEC